MNYASEVSSPLELPNDLQRIVYDFLGQRDDKVAKNLREAGYEANEVMRLQSLWSANSTCLESIELVRMLEKEAVVARTIVNEHAFETTYQFMQFAQGTNGKSHIIVEAQLGRKTVYIDAFWQQFLLDLSLTIEEVAANPGLYLPHERVLCYEAEHMKDLSTWFALIVRTLQNKAVSGSLLANSEMFTREVSVIDVFMRKKIFPPVDYPSIEQLEKIADRIWNPRYFKIIKSEEIEE